MSFDTLMKIEPIALIRPPCINIAVNQSGMLVPMGKYMRLIKLFTRFGWYGSMQCGQLITIPGNDMHYYLYVHIMQIIDNLRRFPLKYLGIKIK